MVVFDVLGGGMSLELQSITIHHFGFRFCSLKRSNEDQGPLLSFD